MLVLIQNLNSEKRRLPMSKTLNTLSKYFSQLIWLLDKKAIKYMYSSNRMSTLSFSCLFNYSVGLHQLKTSQIIILKKKSKVNQKIYFVVSRIEIERSGRYNLLKLLFGNVSTIRLVNLKKLDLEVFYLMLFQRFVYLFFF